MYNTDKTKPTGESMFITDTTKPTEESTYSTDTTKPTEEITQCPEVTYSTEGTCPVVTCEPEICSCPPTTNCPTEEPPTTSTSTSGILQVIMGILLYCTVSTQNK
jgi:hypothetical protein